MKGISSGSTSLRITRPTVVSMYCLTELDRLGVGDVLAVEGRAPGR
jgi:hypothetical protein